MFTWNLITDVTWQIAIYFTCAFLASIVRGCIGFGFSVLMIASTALFLNPALLVPTVIMLEIVASIHMLPSVWKEALWKELVWIMLGLFIGIPIGVYILSIAPEDVLRLLAAIAIFVLTLVVLKGVSYKGGMTTKIYTGIGLISGFFSGLAAAGGIVAATCLSFGSLPMRQVRATLVIYLFLTGFIFLLSSLFAGNLDVRSFNTTFYTVIPMFVGIHIGGKLFRFLDEAMLRKIILVTLVVLSVVGMVRALITFY